MKVRVEVQEIELEGDHGMVPSICVVCTECDESVEVFGRSERSVRRGCVMLKEACGSGNYYVCEDYESDDA